MDNYGMNEQGNVVTIVPEDLYSYTDEVSPAGMDFDHPSIKDNNAPIYGV